MNQLPPGGLPMRMAMAHLYDGPQLELLRLFNQLEAASRGDDPSLASTARTVWSQMAFLALQGQIEVTGFPLGLPTEQTIGVSLLISAQPDFNRQRLQTDAGVFGGVLVRPMSAPQMVTPLTNTENVEPSRRRSGTPGRPSSAQLYQAEMRARHSRNEMLLSVGAEAAYLSKWLAREHPLEPAATKGAVENKIRDEHRSLKPPLER